MSLSDGWAWEQEFGHTTYRHETKRLYSTQQTPDWLNHRKTAP